MKTIPLKSNLSGAKTMHGERARLWQVGNTVRSRPMIGGQQRSTTTTAIMPHQSTGEHMCSVTMPTTSSAGPLLAPHQLTLSMVNGLLLVKLNRPPDTQIVSIIKPDKQSNKKNEG